MINPALHESPRHLKLIASMVIGYSELEISFAHIAGLVLGLKFEVLHALEKVSSETGRIKIIHALSKGAFGTAGLSEEYHIARSMMFYCAGVRNRYAHCHWRRNSKTQPLEYVDGRDLFKDAREIDQLPWKPITVKLLREQEAYFEGTRKWLMYLELTLGQRGKQHPDSWTKPPRMQQPPESSLSPKLRRPRQRKTHPARPAEPPQSPQK